MTTWSNVDVYLWVSADGAPDEARRESPDARRGHGHPDERDDNSLTKIKRRVLT